MHTRTRPDIYPHLQKRWHMLIITHECTNEEIKERIQSLYEGGEWKRATSPPLVFKAQLCKIEGGKKVLLFSHVKQVPNYPLQ